MSVDVDFEPDTEVGLSCDCGSGMWLEECLATYMDHNLHTENDITSLSLSAKENTLIKLLKPPTSPLLSLAPMIKDALEFLPNRMSYTLSFFLSKNGVQLGHPRSPYFVNSWSINNLLSKVTIYESLQSAY
jgi:hypothetical protein